MGCCCSTDDSVKADRRHPLLREQHPTSSDIPKEKEDQSSNTEQRHTSGTETMNKSSSTKMTSIEHKKDLNNIENRALVDSLRGPPVSVYMTDSMRSPEIIRSALNGFMRMESFRLPDDKLPLHVWFKIHFKDIIEHIRVFNILIHKNCKSRSSCKTMAGPPNVVYKWNCNNDGFYSDTIDKNISASSYIERVIDTTTMLLKTHFGKSLTEMEDDTIKASKTIVSLIFRVYCHVLYHHHDLFAMSYALPHLNSCFTWFILFSTEADLLDEEESAPLSVLIEDIVRVGQSGELFSSEVQDDGLQLSITSNDRLSTFFSSFSDDVSKMTASSFGTNNTFFSSSAE